ncbi:MAG: peptidylprolyl isomerase, partial [Novosphingobium sp.]|nr:peptidylprolyl isomerase [Novosphingobium sp.]
PQTDWTGIDPADLLVMDLAPDAKGRPRRVVIQLLPAPFSQGWVGNVRKLAAAKFWDGTSVYRVQDNYVTQWGDPDGDDKVKAKPLPKGLVEVPERDYSSAVDAIWPASKGYVVDKTHDLPASYFTEMETKALWPKMKDSYSETVTFWNGWPLAGDYDRNSPVHCYGMVGVGRDMPPNTGTGAELYTVIGHAPRHLDRNIALIGRIIEGMEHMSSLPRGHGPLGFYDAAQGDERVPIVSVRLAEEVTDLPRYEYLSTESVSFAKYADARANRRDPFFLRTAGGADVCNIPVPVRRAK